MDPRRRYEAPPIVEAIFECVFADSLSDQQRRKLVMKLKQTYKFEAPQKNINTHLDLDRRDARFEEIDGTRLASDDQTDVVIVFPHSMIWAKLAPYSGGDEFIDRIMGDLSLAKTVFGIRSLARMGLRYINRIDVPKNGSIVPYEDYIAINLSLPDQLDPINAYGWNFEKEFLDLNLLGKVQSASMLPEVPNTLAFLIDIDVIARTDLPLKHADIRSKLNKMRELKNFLFELCITDKARESFS